MALRSQLLRKVFTTNGSQVRQLHELKGAERAGVARLREVLEDRIQDIKRAKTFKHERVITSPQDTKCNKKSPLDGIPTLKDHFRPCNPDAACNKKSPLDGIPTLKDHFRPCNPDAAVRVQGAEGEFLNFCANNYLGLSNHPEVVEAAREGLRKYGAGLSSVRFICGTQTLHKELEQRLAQFHGREDAILYGSCFDANAGLFESMLTPEDAVFSDALNHASIIDGIRLCKAQKYRYPHRDLSELEHLLAHSDARIKLIVTDGVFSMDGNVAPLPGLRELADKYRALLCVDDSHATGFFGATGRGTEEYCGVMGAADIICSTLGKAVSGSAGGYTTGPKELITLLRNVSRPYLFSNAPPPPVVAASLKSLDLVEGGSELRARLQQNTRAFREGLQAAGLTVAGDDHPICPVMVGEAPLAVELASGMLKRGIYVVAFSYPVVPKGGARVRVQLSAAHAPDDVDRAVHAFEEVGKAIGLVKG